MEPKVKVKKISELTPDDKNANRGTPRGNAALEHSLQQYGAGRSILLDKKGRIIAGNKTVENAGQIGMEDVVVVQTDGTKLVAVQRTDIDIDDARGRGLAVADNRTAELNLDWDATVLTELDKEVDLSAYFTQTELEELREMDAENLDELIQEDEEDDEDRGNVHDFADDPIFSSTNDLGIPDLLPDRLADASCYATQTWAGQAIKNAEHMMFVYGTNKFPAEAKAGMLCFYVDDERFESVWNEAVEIVRKFYKFGWRAICSPDFSLWKDDPAAVQIWNLYRSRWVARYWQEAGLKIIPSLVGYDERSCEWGAMGIPKNPPMVAMQCRTGTGNVNNRKNVINKLRMGHELIGFENVILYGGDIHRAWIEPELPSGVNAHWLESWTTARDSVRKGRRR